MVPRQSAALRVAETKTLLSIRPITEVHTLLQDDIFKGAIAQERARGEIDREAFERIVTVQEETDNISAGTRNELLDAPWAVVQEALEYLAKRDLATYDALIKDELAGLWSASLHGAPPQGSHDTGRVRHVLEIKADSSEVLDAGGARMRITPIQKLRTVTVQVGFRRSVGGWEMHPRDGGRVVCQGREEVVSGRRVHGGGHVHAA